MKYQKSKRIFLNFKLSFCILIFAFCIFSKIEAAKLDLTSQIQEIGVGQQFQVDLALDTEGEEINAIEGKVVFPSDLLEFKEIRDGNSIVNFWIERPRIEQTGAIVFSGITPGGFQGEQGLIFSAIFEAKKEGGGEIEVIEVKTLLNDGRGTSANLSIFNFQFLIAEEIPAAPLMVETVKDTDPPEDFEPEIAQSPDMFSGKYFLVFVTQDKGSGIDHYEIQENRRQKIENRKWIVAESPYVLKDQNLRSYIYVKAIDKTGNERIAVVGPRYPVKWYENWWIWSIIILGIVIGFILWKIKRRKSSSI